MNTTVNEKLLNMFCDSVVGHVESAWKMLGGPPIDPDQIGELSASIFVMLVQTLKDAGLVTPDQPDDPDLMP